MDAHPNVALAEQALEAYAAGDHQRLRQHLAADVLWHVGGNHQLSGDYHGIDEVLTYFDRARALTGGSLTLEPIEVMADDRFGAIILRARGHREEKSLDVVLAEAFKLDGDGRWAEYWALANDQRAVDAFWGGA